MYASERHMHPPCAGKFSPLVGKGKGQCGSCQSTRSCSAPPVPKHLSDTGKKRNHSYSNRQCCCFLYPNLSHSPVNASSFLCRSFILPIISHPSDFPSFPCQMSSPCGNRGIPVPQRFSEEVRFCSFLLKEEVNILAFVSECTFPLSLQDNCSFV